MSYEPSITATVNEMNLRGTAKKPSNLIHPISESFLLSPTKILLI